MELNDESAELIIFGHFLCRLQPVVFGFVRSGEKMDHSWLFRTFEISWKSFQVQHTQRVSPTDFPIGRCFMWLSNALVDMQDNRQQRQQ